MRNYSLDLVFYVYVYLNPLKSGKFVYGQGELKFDYEPFYIGKGKKSRFLVNLNNAIKYPKPTSNSEKLNTIRKILKSGISPEEYKEKYIIKLQKDLIEIDAYNYEEYYITLIGRKILNNGSLTNFTSGGDGGFNPISWNTGLTKETDNRLKIVSIKNSLFFKGKTYQEIMKDPVKAIKKSENHSKSMKGENHYLNKMSSEEKEEWISKNMKKENNYLYVDISKENQNKICNLYENGKNPKQINEETKFGITVIKRILKENNIKIRNPKESCNFKPKILCKHCNKEFNSGNYKRYCKKYNL